MSAFAHFLNTSKRVILETFSLIGLLDVLVFAGCFLVFALLYFLACIFDRVRFFIPQIFKFLAFSVLLLTPVGIYYLGQEVLYKHNVSYKVAKRLEYSPTYVADGTISNVGKWAIAHCVFIVEGLREPSSKKHTIANAILPLATYKYRIQQAIPVGDSINFREVIQDFPYAFYRERIECYGGR